MSQSENATSALRQSLSRVPRFMRNRYAVALVAFAIYITFFDHCSVINRLRLNQTPRDLEEQQAQYVKVIEDSKQLRETIKADEVKFAREQYFLKHADEDVFIVE